MIAGEDFERLKSSLSGDLFIDPIHRVIYSTDASAYKEEPLAVAYPKNDADIIQLVNFARNHKISIEQIP
jgi:FAD/FMN-containing dehydrogenase